MYNFDYQTDHTGENNFLAMSNEENFIEFGKEIFDLDTQENVQSKRFFLADEDDLSDDGAAWSEKPVQDWSDRETINWLLSAARYLGQPYSSIQESLVVPGKDLIVMMKEDFKRHDEIYGEKLYDLLHSQHLSKSLHIPSEDEFSRSSNLSDVESDSSEKALPKRSPGRPRVSKCKKTLNNYGKLWQFIVSLLHDAETCPSLICWEDHSQGKFRFVRNDEVAKKWGARKGNTKMTYEKLSRAMRYYYKSQIFLPVLGRRLVYQFGPNATGWQTDNPNFQRK